ncbi:type II toxin-antitoxin system Phd/YefM family antitoxin [Motilimonas eburnea]|uniref:type II toxin-antitoxin system Phd/YefM family antitoxin n=1 Tax=Motilimonas eburnea TaxID=1737488 RepID=UPI001E2EC402|nr:type II toxin-antitoxin system Phd/YefM family antitoxin [Motilimonas eburnea]MCE2571831.1 type II toxin-antitoxin system Phd/YefM family antitoxin [Motilimonas eburnea]
MRIETISYLKKNAATLDLDEPMTITQNGKPAYVIESYQERKKREEAIALLKLISFSESDDRHNRVLSSETFKDKLAKRKALLKGDNDEANTPS